jgi:SAM-dependent methyltransferase
VLEALKKLAIEVHHRTVRVPGGARVVASLARHVGRAESLLDVGCGDGVNTLALADAIGATRVAGVDVVIRQSPRIEVVKYDGRSIPFPDGSFEIISIVDVLHHADDPDAVLREALRVASRFVVIKDHFRFGPVSNRILYLMDRAGNAKDEIFCPANYFHPQQWVAMIERAGGHIAALEWPLKVHDLPGRLVAWSQLQFSAKVVPNHA